MARSMNGMALALVLACIAYCSRSVEAQCKSASGSFSATEIATYNTNCTGAGCVEVLAYDKKTKRVAVVLSTNSAIVILDMADPYKPVQLANLTMGILNGETGYGAPNSVAAYNGYIAVAMDAQIKTNPGYVRLYSLADGFNKVGEVMVAAMPDMITFSADGKKLYLACEGEPSTQDTLGSDPNTGANPSGTVDIVNVSWNSTGIPTITGTKSLNFQTYIDSLTDTQYTDLLAKGMKIDPRVTDGKSRAAIDIEPEYIALSDDGLTAYVTLQENSAIGVIDLVNEAIVDIRPLGARNLNNAVADLSDRNGINLTTWTNVNLWYQPDTIDFRTIGGVGYIFIANEGDSKEEKLRVASVGGTNGANFDSAAFPNAQALMATTSLGRFNMDPLSGIVGGYNASKAWNAQGPYNKIYGYGGRSFSIIRASDGLVVFDSGSKFEELIASNPIANKCFNCDRDKNAADSRSPSAGVEPEGIATVQLGECTYAIIGLERQSGLMIYDVTNPSNATYVDYIVNRNFTTNSTKAADIGQLAPEMIKIVSAKDSPIPGKPLMLVTNEFSGSVVVYVLPAEVSASSPLKYKASLAGAQEVPAVSTKATGLVSVTLFNASYATGYFYATNINQMTRAHLHAGAVGVNGPVIAWAFNATYGAISGSVKASFTFNPSLNNISSFLAAGQVYFNVHTAAYPAGELRGQLTLPTTGPMGKGGIGGR